MARRTKQDAEKTRLNILKAALELFSTKGYEKTTFENIAKRIKLSKGAVYWHFNSKPELLRQLVVFVIDEATGEQRIINSQPETFMDLRRGLKEWMSRIIDVPLNRKHIKMLLELDWSRPALKDVKEQFKMLDNSLINVAALAFRKMREHGELKPDADVFNAAHTVALTWIGILHCQLRVDDLEYNVNEVLDFLMDSVGRNVLL